MNKMNKDKEHRKKEPYLKDGWLKTEQCDGIGNAEMGSRVFHEYSVVLEDHVGRVTLSRNLLEVREWAMEIFEQWVFKSVFK